MLHAVWAGPGESNSARERGAREGDCEHNSQGVKARKHCADWRLPGSLFWLEQLLVVINKNKALHSSFSSQPQMVFLIQAPLASFVLE